MKQRLAWRDIENFFSGQWVELVDYEWCWNKPYPVIARVRNYAESRQELLAKIGAKKVQAEERSNESVILFVGAAKTMLQLDSRVAAW